MTHLRIRVFALAACSLLALALAAAAVAADAGSAARGVARAEAAGIRIDPAAVPIMEAAPLGSCLNDPTQTKCAPVRPYAIHVAGTQRADRWTGFAAVPASSGGAHSAAINDQCAVRAHYLGWVSKAVSGTRYGQAQAEGENKCTTAVTEQELFVQLESWWNTRRQWIQESTYSSGPRPGGLTIKGWAKFHCKSRASRKWRNVSQGYSDLKGVWYAGQNVRDVRLGCQG